MLAVWVGRKMKEGEMQKQGGGKVAWARNELLRGECVIFVYEENCFTDISGLTSPSSSQYPHHHFRTSVYPPAARVS